MNIKLIPATTEQKSVVQNMARFYAYDMSKYCGHNPNWEFPEDGLYEAHDFGHFWEPGNFPFIIRINDELGGFALINSAGSTPDVNWDMGEFFIVGKFQGKGMGRQVGRQIFNQFQGVWEVRQMPDNMPAIKFWKSVINDYSKGQFSETLKTFTKPDNSSYKNIVLKFDSNQ